jgi:hypothetical protein
MNHQLPFICLMVLWPDDSQYAHLTSLVSLWVLCQARLLAISPTSDLNSGRRMLLPSLDRASKRDKAGPTWPPVGPGRAGGGLYLKQASLTSKEVSSL